MISPHYPVHKLFRILNLWSEDDGTLFPFFGGPLRGDVTVTPWVVCFDRHAPTQFSAKGSRPMLLFTLGIPDIFPNTLDGVGFKGPLHDDGRVP
jgi:hypothetical protein